MPFTCSAAQLAYTGTLAALPHHSIHLPRFSGGCSGCRLSRGSSSFLARFRSASLPALLPSAKSRQRRAEMFGQSSGYTIEPLRLRGPAPLTFSRGGTPDSSVSSVSWP